MSKLFIYEGDAYEILDRLAPNSVDLVYTSPAPAFFEYERTNDKRVVGTEENNMNIWTI